MKVVPRAMSAGVEGADEKEGGGGMKRLSSRETSIRVGEGVESGGGEGDVMRRHLIVS